jgi:Dyp-type peroxidase family
VVNAATADRGPAALVERLVATVFQAGDARALPALLGADAAAARSSCARVLDLRAAFPDARVTIEELIGAGDAVATRLTLAGTHLADLGGTAPTGRPVRLPLFAMYRVDAGRISEAFHGWDSLALRAQLTAAPPAEPVAETEPVLELADIQGNVFPGFAKDHLAVLGLRMTAVPAARSALQVLAREVATAAEVWAFGRLFARTRARRGHEGAVRACWVNAALSYPALLALAPDAAGFTDAAFRGTAGARDPAPDLLLLIAADDESAVDHEAARLTATLAPGFTVHGTQRGHALPGEARGFEHFGFRDGISQPGVRGRHPAPPHEPVTARLNPVDPDEGKPGQALLQPGEFIFGYPGEGDVDGVPGPVTEAGPAWARHGSFLVYGRYRQDVAAFERFVDRTTATLRREVPALAGFTPQQLAALVIGRWRSGAPLVSAPRHDDPGLGADDRAGNDFAYRWPRPAQPGTARPPAPADPQGLRCPYAAHIRKANIRDDLDGRAGRGAARRHRMLRRGIPYGPPGTDGQDRGLLFLSYQTSIERQFEFVRERWLDDDGLRAPGEGIDLIAGRAAGTFGIPVPEGAGTRIVPVRVPEPFTELVEGGYFFTPGVSGLRRLAGAR